eukprot:3496882-Amphidinium_carterae.1
MSPAEHHKHAGTGLAASGQAGHTSLKFQVELRSLGAQKQCRQVAVFSFALLTSERVSYAECRTPLGHACNRLWRSTMRLGPVACVKMR